MKKASKLLLPLALLSLCVPSLANGKAVDLRIGENFAQPLGFHLERPYFSWKLPVAPGVQSQSAYRIEVASSLAALESEPDIWDSGKVVSSQSAWVPYVGAPLESRQKAWWRVRYWDQDGREQDWSEPTHFELGLLASDDWQAEWIMQRDLDGMERKPDLTLRILHAEFGADGKRKDVTEAVASMVADGFLLARVSASQFDLAPGGNTLRVKYAIRGEAREITIAESEVLVLPEGVDLIPVSTFRKAIILEKKVSKARLYATALGAYEFYINGERVGVDELAPGWTAYEKRVSSLTYDVTGSLKQGVNIIHGLLGQGWYSGRLVRQHLPNAAGKTPKLMAQLEVTYEDGSSERFMTDGTWKVSNEGPIRYSDLYEGERYDARREFVGIGGPEFDDGAWQAAEVAQLDSLPAITPKRFGSVVRHETLQPVQITAREPGSYVLDFAKNLVGWPRLKMPLKAGQTIRMRFAEMLQPNGEFYTENYRTARSTNYYTAASDGEIDWEPTFTFHGYRYLEISGLDPNAAFNEAWVTSVVLHSDFNKIGEFDSSHSMLNQLQRNILWSTKGNFLEVPTDCPQRDERLGWTGDAQVFAATSLFNFDLTAFWMAWLETMRDEQGSDGHIPVIVPAPKNDWGGSSGWGDACVVIPWELYLRTGNSHVLEENYEMMQGWLRYHQSRAEQGISSMGSFGDWLQPHADQRKGETPIELISTAYFARVADLLARVASVLNRDEDAQGYQELSRRVKSSFTKKYFDDTGRLAIEKPSQTAYLLALGFDLLPLRLRAGAEAGLMETFTAADRHLRTGFLGTPLIAPVFDELGRPDLSYELLFKETYPSWFYTIKQGAKTMWERWDAYDREVGFAEGDGKSLNHYAYGAIGEWVYERVAGLAPDPDSPGYKHFYVQPVLGGPLTNAGASLETPFGLARSSWTLSKDKLIMNVVVPPNTTATIIFPSGDHRSISFDGKPIGELNALISEAMIEEQFQATIGAGQYRFEIDL